MSTYTSDTPSDLDPEYKRYYEDFYKLSDTHPTDGGTAEKYAARFTPDATFILAGKVATGTEEIIKAREAMWEKVSSRQHTPNAILSLGKGDGNADEVMIHGTVEYTTKDGAKDEKTWAARAVLTKKDGEVKMNFYQIWL